MEHLKRPRGRPPKNGKCKCGIRVAFAGAETELEKLKLFHGGARCGDWPDCADGPLSKRCRHMSDDSPELWTHATFLDSLRVDRSASYLMACLDVTLRPGGHVVCETCSGEYNALCDACDKLRMDHRRLRARVEFQTHAVKCVDGVDVVSTRVRRLSVGLVYAVGPEWARYFVMDEAACRPLFADSAGPRIHALAMLCVYVCGSCIGAHANRAGNGPTFVATILIQRWWRRSQRRRMMLLVYTRVRSGNCVLQAGRFGPATAIVGGPARVYATAVKAVRDCVKALVAGSENHGDANNIIYADTPTGLAPALATVVARYWFAMRVQRTVCYTNYLCGRRVYCTNTYTALNVCHMTIIKGRASLVGVGSQFSLLGVMRTIAKCTRTDATLTAEFVPPALPDQRIDPELMVTVYNHSSALVGAAHVHATLSSLLASIAGKLNDQNPHLLIF